MNSRKTGRSAPPWLDAPPPMHSTPPRRRNTRRKRRSRLPGCLFSTLAFFGLLFGACWLGMLLADSFLPDIESPKRPMRDKDDISWLLPEGYKPEVGEAPYRVAVDAGHGGADTGAQGFVEEKSMTEAAARALLALLEKDANFIPLLTRESYEMQATPAERAENANAQDAQLLLSIHANSAETNASGFEAYPVTPGGIFHQESLYFGMRLAEQMKAAGQTLRGYGGLRYAYYNENGEKFFAEVTQTAVRKERSFGILENAACPAVLAEQCFVTNEADAAQWGSEEGCQRAAQAYYLAICAYFGTEPVGSEEENPAEELP